MARSLYSVERVEKMASGIVCKVWNVLATKKKGCVSQLNDSIGYILDDEKTETKLTGETVEQFNEKQLGRECQYIENDIKTVDGAYVATQNLASSDVSGAVKEMMDVKKFYGKLGGRAALHGIISLPVEESGKERAADLMALCADVMKQIFPNHQAVFAVHTNTDNLHIHFIVNSVGLDGRKIHQPKNFISEVLQPCINEYARQHGFTPNTEWSKQKHGVSDYVALKMRLREAIDLAIESADSYDEFRENLKKMGFRVNCGKHISIKDADMDKAMRTHQLGANYSKEAIVERIMTRKLAFEQIHISDSLRATMAQGVAASGKDVFNPAFATMKKYRDMSADERKRVAKQLKEGINPWRMRAAMGWQLKEIADELNMTVRVKDYIRAYSSDGTAESALQDILERKKELAAEKKALKHHMQQYKPIIDIYRKMQSFERMAYLYEHEGRGEYRGEYEEYRNLIRRLKSGYGKSVSDVAQFMDSYETQYSYLNSQIGELSKEYRELKQYTEMRGMSTIQDNRLWDMVGYDDLKGMERMGGFEADVKYLASRNNPDVTIRIVKNPYTDEFGKIRQNVEIALFSRYGEMLEQHGLSESVTVLKNFVSKLENDYGLKECESFDNAMLAREFRNKCRTEQEKANQKELSAATARSEKPKEKRQKKAKKTYSFTQALNLLSARGEKGIYVIANAENPSYIGTVFSDNDGIRLKITDLKGNSQEEFEIPNFKNRSRDSYGILKGINKKYGFSDVMYAFDNVEDARRHLAEEKTKNTR